MLNISLNVSQLMEILLLRILCLAVNHMFLFLFFVFFKTGFLCKALAVLEFNSVDQAGLELRNLSLLPKC